MCFLWTNDMLSEFQWLKEMLEDFFIKDDKMRKVIQTLFKAVSAKFKKSQTLLLNDM